MAPLKKFTQELGSGDVIEWEQTTYLVEEIESMTDTDVFLKLWSVETGHHPSRRAVFGEPIPRNIAFEVSELLYIVTVPSNFQPGPGYDVFLVTRDREEAIRVASEITGHIFQQILASYSPFDVDEDLARDVATVLGAPQHLIDKAKAVVAGDMDGVPVPEWTEAPPAQLYAELLDRIAAADVCPGCIYAKSDCHCLPEPS